MRIPECMTDLLHPGHLLLLTPPLDGLVPRLPHGLAVLLEAHAAQADGGVQAGQHGQRAAPKERERH